MKQIGEIRRTEPRKAFQSERAEYIFHLTEGVNRGRAHSAYPKLSPRVIAIKTAHLTIQDMHAFLKKCREADNFGRCFFGMLKPKDDTQT